MKGGERGYAEKTADKLSWQSQSRTVSNEGGDIKWRAQHFKFVKFL